jgi:hypothetical protein
LRHVRTPVLLGEFSRVSNVIYRVRNVIFRVRMLRTRMPQQLV